MGYQYLGLLSFLPYILSIVGQWIGVVAIRTDRGKTWWMLLAGTALSTLGLMFSFTNWFTAVFNFGTINLDNKTLIIFAMSAFGTLLFFAGFAMHGLELRSRRNHEAQLAAIQAAMAEELRALRERVG